MKKIQILIKAQLQGIFLDELLSFPPFLTVSGLLALHGLNDKVALLQGLGASASHIAQGYAEAGNHSKVEKYRTQYNASVNTITQGYAKAGNHSKVEEYRTQHHASVNFIAQSYALAGNHSKVEEYRTQHYASVNPIAQGYALAGNHSKVEEYRNQHNASVNSIAYGYALAGNHFKVEEYRTQYQASVNSIASDYAFAGNHSKVEEYRNQHNASVNSIAYGYALAGNHFKVEEYRNQHNVSVKTIVQGYVKAGNHSKVEEYRSQHQASVKTIVQGYALAGNHAKVEEYRTQHQASVKSIAQGYVKAGNHSKVEEYRTQHQASVNSIAQGYALAGSHAKVEEYRSQHQASVNSIAQGYALAGNHAKVEEYRSQHQASVDSIIQGYASVNNHLKVEEYLTQHQASIYFIVKGYYRAGNHIKAEEYQNRPFLFNRKQAVVNAFNPPQESFQPQFQSTVRPQTLLVTQSLKLPMPKSGKRSPSEFHADTIIPMNKKSNNESGVSQSKPQAAFNSTGFLVNMPLQINTSIFQTSPQPSFSPVKKEILPLKKEPEDSSITLDKRPSAIKEFNYQEMIRVVTVLRGKSTASRNCTHLAQDVMHYLRTGEMPHRASLEADSTVEDFVYFPVYERQNVKKESGKQNKVLMVKQASVPVVGPFFQQHSIPAPMEPYMQNNIIYVEKPYVANLDPYSNDQFTEEKTNIRFLEDTLKNKALINGGVSFGYLHLERVKKGAEGHMLVYFSTINETWYIDCQKLNGETQQGVPIYKDLINNYKFYGINFNSIDDRVFQQDVFLIPMAPFIHAPESTNQTVNFLF